MPFIIVIIHTDFILPSTSAVCSSSTVACSGDSAVEKSFGRAWRAQGQPACPSEARKRCRGGGHGGLSAGGGGGRRDDAQEAMLVFDTTRNKAPLQFAAKQSPGYPYEKPALGNSI